MEQNVSHQMQPVFLSKMPGQRAGASTQEMSVVETEAVGFSTTDDFVILTSQNPNCTICPIASFSQGSVMKKISKSINDHQEKSASVTCSENLRSCASTTIVPAIGEKRAP